MIGSYTQCVRNFLCVVKSILPVQYYLQRPVFSYAPHPFNKISTLEGLIAITQFLAVVINIISSYNSMIFGFRQYYRAHYGILSVDRHSVSYPSKGSIEHTILRHGLREDMKDGMTKFCVGIAEFVVGCAFIFLMANSLHLHGIDHPIPLMQALISLEMALLYFIKVILTGIISNVSKASKYANLEKLLVEAMVKPEFKNMKISNRKLMDFACEVGFLNNLMDAYIFVNPTYFPAYRLSYSAIDGIEKDLQEIGKEFVDEKLEDFNNPKKVVTVVRSVVNPTFCANLLIESRSLYVEAFFDFLILSLNVLAGWGYWMCILAFYYPDAYTTANAVPVTADPMMHFISRIVMLQLSPSRASFYGNFLGDFAWMLEPLLVISKPTLLRWFSLKKYVAKKEL